MTRTFQDAAGLRGLIRNRGGVLELSMAELRDARLAGRLGCHVRTDIGKWLTTAGIGWLPERLPNDQRHVVTLYLHDSPAGMAFDVARHVQAADAASAKAVVA
jgi:hypothetical protein